MMEKVLADQGGRNVEIYLEEIVIKSKNEQDLVQGVEETLRKLKRVNIKIDPITSSFGVKEGRFLGHMVAREGQIHPKIYRAEVSHSQGPNEVRYSRRIWLDEQSRRSPPKDKKEIEQIANIGYSNRTRGYDAMSMAKNSPREKDGWQNGLSKYRHYDISCIQRKEAEGSIVNKFFGQGEQVHETPDANEGEASNLSKKLQAKSTPTPRAWRLYMGKETIKEVSLDLSRLATTLNRLERSIQIGINRIPHSSSQKNVLNHLIYLRRRAVLGQRKTKHFQPIHYASKTISDAQAHYTTTKKELLYPIWEVIQKGNGPSLLSQLEIHGAGVSTEDANQKFLRSLPSSWSQVSLVMRTKPGVDSLSIDDLYNNLRVFESDIKGSTGSSSSAQNVAFVSSESTSSTNDVSTAYGVSTSSGYNSQRENSSSYTDELMYSFFANQSSGPHLDHEDLEQLDEFDLEEMDLKWQVAMISMRLKKFYKKTGRKLHFDAKEPVGFDKTKVECYNCHKTGHFARECRSKGNTGYKSKDNGRRPGKQEEPKALVTLDGEGVDWTDHAEDEQENFALMAYSNSGSDTEVTSCSKECVESYAKLKKLYDEQREQLGDASIEIQAYTQALKKVEAQLVTHQKNQLWYEEKIRFMKIDLDDKTDVLTYHKKLLAEVVKEKEELKTKLKNF
ncbi:ribonuclease H-like domain-containing protein [Tanacetum coccineum]